MFFYRGWLGKSPGRQIPVMPLCRKSASILGSRPRKAVNDSSAERLPPTPRISLQKR